MKLRYVVLLTSAIGACGALLLAADLYRRLKEAEAAAAVTSGPLRDDSVLTFGMYHTMGLLSLAFFFMALFLLLVSALRDKQYVVAIEGTSTTSTPPPTQPAMAPIIEPAIPVVQPTPPNSVPIEVVPIDSVPPSPPPEVPIDAKKKVLAFEIPIEKPAETDENNNIAPPP
jgi:hypothetical protein